MKPKLALKLRDGYLLGNPQCPNCIELWLQERRVSFERTEEFPEHALDLNDPTVLYEVTSENSVRLDCRIEKHPECSCLNVGYIETNSKKLIYAFSSIVSVKTARYATPDGNVWLTSAKHRNGHTAMALASERETSRKLAVDKAMAKAEGEVDTMEALANEVASSYQAKCKNPMLIVGANNWLRSKIPFFLLQQYDIHLLFYPNSHKAWVFSVVAISRVHVDAKPLWSFAASRSASDALKHAAWGLLLQNTPSEFQNESSEAIEKVNPKLIVWQTNWIYRSPKISLKDVLHLENYEEGALDFKPNNEVLKPKSIFRVLQGGKV